MYREGRSICFFGQDWRGDDARIYYFINNQYQHWEPLIHSEFPVLPWQKFCTTLFKWESSSYVLVIDYIIDITELSKLTYSTSEEVVNHLAFLKQYGMIINHNICPIFSTTLLRIWIYSHYMKFKYFKE